MRLDNLVRGDACAALERVDVLGKACVKEVVRGQQADEGVREGGSEFSWVELARECVDCVLLEDSEYCKERQTRDGILFEKVNLENGFGVWEVQP